MSDKLYQRTLGAYLGLAVGDALGATVEFMLPREIQSRYGIHKEIIGGGWLRLQAGQTTDDTAMSLAMGRGILASGGWDLNAIADQFVLWLKSKPVDIGNTCRRGIRRYIQDGSLSGPIAEGDAGNGACMRTLPAVIMGLASDELLVRYTLEQSHLTHNNPLADAGTLAIARMLRVLLLGGGVKECREIANRLLQEYPKYRFDPYPGRASGYILDTLQTVLQGFFYTDSFEEYLVWVVNRGEDADTTGAIAGMLGGAMYGVEGIPLRWRTKLELDAAHEVTEQVDSLLELATGVCYQPAKSA